MVVAARYSKQVSGERHRKNQASLAYARSFTLAIFDEPIMEPRSCRLAFDKPNQIAASIIEIGKLRRTHVFRLVFKRNAFGLQALELGDDVFGVELRQRNAILVKSLLQRDRRRMTGRFKQKLHALGIVWRDEREPSRFADRNVMFEAKAEDISVESARCWSLTRMLISFTRIMIGSLFGAGNWLASPRRRTELRRVGRPHGCRGSVCRCS